MTSWVPARTADELHTAPRAAAGIPLTRRHDRPSHQKLALGPNFGWTFWRCSRAETSTFRPSHKMWSRKMRRLTQFPRILPAAGRGPLLSRPRLYSTTHETVVAIKNRGSETEPVASASDPSRPSSLDFDFGFDNWSEINPVAKTIDTAAGKLPISPLLDPSWRKARLRKKKKIPPPKALSVRFQRRTAENVYGEPLGTLRCASGTFSCLLTPRNSTVSGGTCEILSQHKGPPSKFSVAELRPREASRDRPDVVDTGRF